MKIDCFYYFCTQIHRNNFLKTYNDTKMAKNIYLILLYPIMAAVIIQYFAGNFPFHFFEFPLNIILGAIWIYSVYMLLRKNNCTNNITRVLVSPETTAFSLFLFVCGSADDV